MTTTAPPRYTIFDRAHGEYLADFHNQGSRWADPAAALQWEDRHEAFAVAEAMERLYPNKKIEVVTIRNMGGVETWS
jgi:hypothetical protein